MYTEPFIRIITIKRRPKCKYCWNYVEFIAILFATIRMQIQQQQLVIRNVKRKKYILIRERLAVYGNDVSNKQYYVSDD